MRVRIISDIHGKDCWKQAIEDGIDLYLFQADYVDSFDKTSEQIYGNLMDIIEFKKKNYDKVILLLGNHDIPYLYLGDPVVPSCSGFRSDMAYHLHFLFRENKDLFQTAHQIGHHLFTHAGISDVWYNKHRDTIKEFWELLSDTNDQVGVPLADVLNALTETRHREILFEVGESRGGIHGNNGGPFWACYHETKLGTLNGYHQYCGHTNRPEIERIEFNKTTSITYCDILNSQPDKFLTIEI